MQNNSAHVCATCIAISCCQKSEENYITFLSRENIGSKFKSAHPKMRIVFEIGQKIYSGLSHRYSDGSFFLCNSFLLFQIISRLQNYWNIVFYFSGLQFWIVYRLLSRYTGIGLPQGIFKKRLETICSVLQSTNI